MTHISRKFLKGKAEQELIVTLIETISGRSNPVQRKKITRELLTGVEKLMLAKRLAVICMLGEGYSFQEISKQLKVSSSTPARLWEEMQMGKYAETIKVARKNGVTEQVVNLIELLLLPRQRHEPRWKFLDTVPN